MSKYELQKFKIDSQKLKKNRKIQIKNNNILSYDDIEFISMNDVKNSKEFKFLSIEERLLITNNYLKSINISDVDKEFIIDLVKKEKLKNKCDISFDKVNKKLLSINLLFFKEKENLYIIKEKEVNIKHYNSKKLINNLLKS